MKDHGSPTLKPTMLLTNSAAICKLHNAKAEKVGKSRVSKSKLRKKGKAKGQVALCRRYVDKQGRQRFAGTKKLKESQTLSLNNLGSNIHNSFGMSHYIFMGTGDCGVGYSKTKMIQ